MKKIIGLLTLIFLFAGCEKDDICDPTTATTPNLVIEFYDYSQPTLTKNVVNLKITGDGMTTAFNTFSGTSKIKVPLKSAADSTKLNATGGIIQSDPATPDTFWIKDFDILTNSINNQNEVHLKIYF